MLNVEPEFLREVADIEASLNPIVCPIETGVVVVVVGYSKDFFIQRPRNTQTFASVGLVLKVYKAVAEEESQSEGA